MVVCACTTPGTLLVTASPQTIDADGSETIVSFLAIRSSGAQGRGTVRVGSTAGTLLMGREVALDVSGRAEVVFACDERVDAKCQGEVVVKGSWEGVEQEVRVQVRTVSPVDGGAAGAGGGEGGCLGLGGGAADAGSACADGTREGLWAQPDVAACEGFFSGLIDEGSAASLCGDGWSVCQGTSAALGCITQDEATTTVGCFAYDAAQDCGECFATCRSAGMGSKTCAFVGQPALDPDMAAVGNGCGLPQLPQRSCLPRSTVRIDASRNTTGCQYQPKVTGVLCCRNR